MTDANQPKTTMEDMLRGMGIDPENMNGNQRKIFEKASKKVNDDKLTKAQESGKKALDEIARMRQKYSSPKSK